MLRSPLALAVSSVVTVLLIGIVVGGQLSQLLAQYGFDVGTWFFVTTTLLIGVVTTLLARQVMQVVLQFLWRTCGMLIEVAEVMVALVSLTGVFVGFFWWEMSFFMELLQPRLPLSPSLFLFLVDLPLSAFLAWLLALGVVFSFVVLCNRIRGFSFPNLG